MSKTNSFSTYLHTSGLDFMKAYKMVKATINDLRKISRDFTSVVCKAQSFVQSSNEELEGKVIVENTLPATRKKTTDMHNDPLKAFEINVP